MLESEKMTLIKKMAKHAENLEFEEAAKCRDKIKKIDEILLG